MKKITLLTFIALSFYTFATAQNFKVPKNYQLKNPSDYAELAPQVIQATEWLKNNALNKQTQKRQGIENFVKDWLNGNPEIDIQPVFFVSVFTEKNPELLTVFKGAWASYLIQNPAEKDPIKLHTVGLEAMIQTYMKGGVVEEKFYEKLSLMLNEGSVGTWVENQFKVE